MILEEIGPDGEGIRFRAYDMNSLAKVELRLGRGQDGQLSEESFIILDDAPGQAAPATDARAAQPVADSPAGPAEAPDVAQPEAPPVTRPNRRPAGQSGAGKVGAGKVGAGKVGAEPATQQGGAGQAQAQKQSTAKAPCPTANEPVLLAVAKRAAVPASDRLPPATRAKAGSAAGLASADKVAGPAEAPASPASTIPQQGGGLESSLEAALRPADQLENTQPIDLSALEVVGEQFLITPSRPVSLGRKKVETRKIEAAWFARGDFLDEGEEVSTASHPKLDPSELERQAAELSVDEYRRYALDLSPPALRPPGQAPQADAPGPGHYPWPGQLAPSGVVTAAPPASAGGASGSPAPLAAAIPPAGAGCPPASLPGLAPPAEAAAAAGSLSSAQESPVAPVPSSQPFAAERIAATTLSGGGAAAPLPGIGIASSTVSTAAPANSAPELAGAQIATPLTGPEPLDLTPVRSTGGLRMIHLWFALGLLAGAAAGIVATCIIVSRPATTPTGELGQAAAAAAGSSRSAVPAHSGQAGSTGGQPDARSANAGAGAGASSTPAGDDATTGGPQGAMGAVGGRPDTAGQLEGSTEKKTNETKPARKIKKKKKRVRPRRTRSTTAR